MNPDLCLRESCHYWTNSKEVPQQSVSFVYDTDVHVEPAAIPEDEIYGNVLHKLSRNEKIILSKILGL